MERKENCHSYFSGLLCTENSGIDNFSLKVTSQSGIFRTRYYSITFWLDPAVAALNKMQYAYDSYTLSSKHMYMYISVYMYMFISCPSQFLPDCAWQRKSPLNHRCFANGEGCCLESYDACRNLLGHLISLAALEELQCFGRLVVLIILLASMLRVH